jgi:hypothetical protein
MSEESKRPILSVLQQYYDDGKRHLDSIKEERERARAVWDCQFLGTVPSGSIYYPTARCYGKSLQMAIVKSYTAMQDIASVSPKRKWARQGSEVIAATQNVIFNSRAKDWEASGEKEKTLNDLALQAIIERCGVARVSWVRNTRKVAVPIQGKYSIGEDGRPVQDTKEVDEIVDNRWEIRYIPRDHAIWDPNATRWVDARWFIERYDKVTPGELRQRAESEGWNMGEVTKCLDRFNSTNQDENTEGVEPDEQGDAKANQTLELCHFWGWIARDDNEAHNIEFARLTFDIDFQYMFMEHYASDPDADKWFYYTPKQEPYIPYVVGFIEPEEGQCEGRSMMELSRPLQGEENSIRNALRRGAEISLNSLWVFKKGSGIDVTQLKGRIAGGYVWSTAEDVRRAVSQFPYQNNSQQGYDCLQLLSIYWQMLWGATPLTMGIVEPANPDAPTAIMQLTNAANQTVYSRIQAFNNTLFEPAMTMALNMSLQYTTEDELKEYGINLQAHGLSMDILQQEYDLTIDTGMGATNDNAKRTMLMQAYWLVQQRNQYLTQSGVVLPMKDIMGPAVILQAMLPLYGQKDPQLYTSTLEELVKSTEAAMAKKQAEMQRMQDQEQQIAGQALQQAGQAGAQAAQAQMMQSSQQPAQEQGAMV